MYKPNRKEKVEQLREIISEIKRLKEEDSDNLAAFTRWAGLVIRDYLGGSDAPAHHETLAAAEELLKKLE